MKFYKSVAIIGAGTMGHALGLVHALAGCNVRLYDNSSQKIREADQNIGRALETLVEAKEISTHEVAAVQDKIDCVDSLEGAVFDADLIIEAISEDAALKQTLYRSLADIMSPSSTLASNTSFLDVFPLIPDSLQNRAMIVHWYSPPYIIDLVDVVPGPVCDSNNTRQMVDFLNSMAKRPIVFKKFLPGYIANRIQGAINQEVFSLIDQEIVSPEDIDCSIIHGLALRLATMGHVQKLDYTGLDIVQSVFAARSKEKGVPDANCRTLDKLVADGAVGVQSGRGFYEYEGQQVDELFRKRDLNLLKLRRQLSFIRED